MLRVRVYDSLIEIKKACMIASQVIVSYTFVVIALNGSITWSEPNNLILYSEGFFLGLSWIGFFLSCLASLREMRK